MGFFLEDKEDKEDKEDSLSVSESSFALCLFLDFDVASAFAADCAFAALSSLKELDFTIIALLKTTSLAFAAALAFAVALASAAACASAAALASTAA